MLIVLSLIEGFTFSTILSVSDDFFFISHLGQYKYFYNTNIVIRKREKKKKKTGTNLTKTIFCLYCSKSNFFLMKFDSKHFFVL